MIVAEQVALYDTLTGVRGTAATPAPADAPAEPMADVVRLPRARLVGGSPLARDMTSVAVLKGGRSLERQVSLASGARVESRSNGSGSTSPRSTSAPTSSTRLQEMRSGRRLHRAARPRRRGRHRAGAARGPRDPLHRLRACTPACAAADKVLTKHALRDGGLPTPDWVSLGEIAFSELGAAAALARVERRLDVPARVKPASQGSSLGVTFAQLGRRGPGRADRRLLVRPQGAARASRAGPRARRLDPRGRARRARAGAADRRGGAARSRLLRLRRPLRRSGAPSSSARPSSRRALPSASTRSRWTRGGCSAAAGSRAST